MVVMDNAHQDLPTNEAWKTDIKVNMNKYKLNKTAAIFYLANLFLYVMVDFIRMGLPEL